MKLWLGNYEADLPIKKISQTFQVNDLAEIKNRDLNFTNKFTLPPTAKNKKIMDFLGATGSNSRKPSLHIPAKFVMNGIEVIREGYAVVMKTTSKGYDLAIYSGNVSLYETIKGKALSDLDFTAYNHTQTLANYVSSLNNTSGYIYAFGDYGDRSVSGVVNIERQSPAFYIHTLIDMIISQAGFTYSGSIFSDANFLKEVIAMSKGWDPVTSYDVVFENIIGDVSQTDFLKDFMQCYGLVLQMDGDECVFKTMEELANDRTTAEDWSDKLVSDQGDVYRIGSYAQSNWMTYSYEDNDEVDNVTHDGELVVNNDNLAESKNLFSSIFKISQRSITRGLEPVYLIPIWEEKNEEGTLVFNNLETDIRKFSIKDVTTTISFRQGASSNSVVNDNKFLSLENISYSYYIANFYAAFGRILDNQVKKKVELLLSPLDLYQLDFFKLKYFKQFGQYYYLNKVSNYIIDRPVKCELIQIHELTVNQPPSQLGTYNRSIAHKQVAAVPLYYFTDTEPPYSDPEFDPPETIRITGGFNNDVLIKQAGITINSQTDIPVADLDLTVEDQGNIVDLHNVAFTFKIQSENSTSFSDVEGTLAFEVREKVNHAPIADAGGDVGLSYDSSSTPNGNTVTLIGGNSSDQDNDPLTYFWSFDNQITGVTLTNATSANATAVATDMAPGLGGLTINARLRVTDDGGLWSEDTCVITLIDLNPNEI